MQPLYPLKLSIALVTLNLSVATMSSAQWDHFGSKPAGTSAGPKATESSSSHYAGGVSAEALLHYQAQSYAQELVRLKVAELDLMSAPTKDDQAIDLVRAKILMVRKEMAELSVVLLKRQRAVLMQTYKSSHPQVQEIDQQIAARLALANAATGL